MPCCEDYFHITDLHDRVRANCSGHQWVGTWASAPVEANLSNSTVRQILHTSVGGSRVRVQLSNEFGTQALRIEDVHRTQRGSARYLPAYDAGDHLHPNDAGMQAIADRIKLGLFLTSVKAGAVRQP